ncbi:hypothetical protein ACFQL1_13585 [Halomicroarcula sp. GCM10025709]|uniref:DUF7537 family lipoprotein n=1 Tax=Haloarcula TaxID=2237 RepID=UPI0024C25D15|nr:hypothetical protein [Halomicroarcula sp. YJ-61-S]
MRNIRITTLLVVLTVVVAGCGGMGVGDGASNGDGASGSDGGASDGSSSDGASGSDGGSSADGAAGDGAAATTDEFAVGDADRLLRDAGSFTAEWSFAVTESDGNTSTVTNTYRVNLAENRSYEAFETAGTDGAVAYESFYADDMTYTKYGDDTESFYQVAPQQTTVFDNARNRALYDYDDFEDAQFVGTEQFDGVTVERYEYSDPTVWRNYGAGAFGSDENVTINDFTVVVLVDEDGLARSTEWTVRGVTDTGEPVSAAWSYTLTDVGSTTVADPDWLDDAKAQSQGA